MSGHVEHDPTLSIVDRFPLSVHRFARARRCCRLQAESAYGHGHIDRRVAMACAAMSASAGLVFVSASLAPSTPTEMLVAEEELLEADQGWVLGDRNCRHPAAARLCERGATLLTRY